VALYTLWPPLAIQQPVAQRRSTTYTGVEAKAPLLVSMSTYTVSALACCQAVSPCGVTPAFWHGCWFAIQIRRYCWLRMFARRVVPVAWDRYTRKPVEVAAVMPVRA
jgi:hypothetical protein